MHVNMTTAIEQIKIKGKDTFITFVDKLSKERSLVKRQNNEREDMYDLLENLNRAKQEWIVASTNYEFAQDEDLIDYYVYALKAAQLKYDYLLRRVKKLGEKITKEDFYKLNIEKDENTFDHLK